MTFFIHQSKLNPRYYVFTNLKNDFSRLPEGILDELGKIRFLRKAHTQEDETKTLSEKYSEIVQNVATRGYHILEIQDK
jgi:uncharacterized protein YcgL (UPF0745 family)